MRRLPLLAAAVAVMTAIPAQADAVTHGDLVSSRPLTSGAALKGAGKNLYVRYKTKGVDGQLVTASGTIAYPKGKAPKGGWPVLTWAHGSTGIADVCAPSAAKRTGALSAYSTYINPLLDRVLKASFVVVRTDYEGLGTPGDHPYLNGTSEGLSVLDIVRAARKLDRKISGKYVIAGHSQGGQAALFAASLAPSWTPELKLGGTVAMAPVSHLGEQAELLRSLDLTSFSAISSIVLRGAQISRPTLNVPSLLTPEATALWPQTLTACLTELGKPTSFAGLMAKQFFLADADIAPLVSYLSEQDAETLTIPGRVMVLQGLADTTVLPLFTDPLVTDLKAKGATVTYKTYKGVDHGGIATSGKSTKDALAFLGITR